MGTVHLAEKYASNLDKRFSTNSLTEAWCGSDYDWNGVNSIAVWTLGKATINDYDVSASGSSYGTLHEVEDEKNVYQLLKKRSINEKFDATNVADTMFIRQASSYLKQIWDEEFVPEIDGYRLGVWANGAGGGAVSGTALTSSTIVKAILTGHAYLSNNRVPKKNRVCFIGETLAIETKLASELSNNQVWTEKAIVNGLINVIGGFPVVAVPDDLLPTGVNFIIKYKSASADPMKLKSLKARDDPENFEGIHMTGLVRYDAFVLANKADGIYVHAQSGMLAAPTFSISSNAVTITGTAGSTIKYTTDGSNPKTSSTASTYSAAVAITANTKFRAYQSKSGSVNSPIATYDAVHT